MIYLIKKTISLIAFMVLGSKCPHVFVKLPDDDVEHRVECNDPGRFMFSIRDHEVINIANMNYFNTYLSDQINAASWSPLKKLYNTMFDLYRNGEKVPEAEVIKMIADLKAKEDEIARLKKEEDQEEARIKAQQDRDAAEEKFIRDAQWDVVEPQEWSVSDVRYDYMPVNPKDIIIDERTETPEEKPVEEPTVKRSVQLEESLAYPKFEIRWVKILSALIDKKYPDTNICPVFLKNDKLLVRLLIDLPDVAMESRGIKLSHIYTASGVKKFEELCAIKVDVIGPEDAYKVYDDDDKNKWFELSGDGEYFKCKIMEVPKVLRIVDTRDEKKEEKIDIHNYENMKSLLEHGPFANKNIAAATMGYRTNLLKGAKDLQEDMPVMFTMHSARLGSFQGLRQIPFEDIPGMLKRNISEPVKHYADIKDLPKPETIIGKPVEIRVKWPKQPVCVYMDGIYSCKESGEKQQQKMKIYVQYYFLVLGLTPDFTEKTEKFLESIGLDAPYKRQISVESLLKLPNLETSELSINTGDEDFFKDKNIPLGTVRQKIEYLVTRSNRKDNPE